jgi:hypothetical protein
LAAQLRDASLTGTPRAWIEYLHQHPEAEADLRAFSQAALPGTRALAQAILSILSR